MAKTEKLLASLRALFDPLVMVTAMTTAALIAAVLALAGQSVTKRILALCVGIAVIGLITIAYQMRRLYRMDRNREIISALLTEGHQLVRGAMQQYPGRSASYFPGDTWDGVELRGVLEGWCRRVEDQLRKRLDESYVTRFHLGGSNEQVAGSMTIQKMNHRLETLASFLTELK